MLNAKSLLVAASVAVIGVGQVRGQVVNRIGTTGLSSNAGTNGDADAVPMEVRAIARVDGFGGSVSSPCNTTVKGQLITQVTYETSQVVVRMRCLADVKLDGLVSLAGFNSWIVNFNTDCT